MGTFGGAELALVVMNSQIENGPLIWLGFTTTKPRCTQPPIESLHTIGCKRAIHSCKDQQTSFPLVPWAALKLLLLLQRVDL